MAVNMRKVARLSNSLQIQHLGSMLDNGDRAKLFAERAFVRSRNSDGRVDEAADSSESDAQVLVVPRKPSETCER